jgi:uncharacterized protein with beta-barrel porin domain
MRRRHWLYGVSASAIATSLAMAPLAMATIILLSAEDASAQTVISGNQTTPVIDSTGSVIVQSGASVNTGTPTAIQLHATSSTLTNSGTITNNNGVSSGVNVNATVVYVGTNGTLVNNGNIVNEFPLFSSSNSTPSIAVLGQQTFSGVVNNGLIQATASAIEVNQGVTGNFINGATGQMISTQGTAVVFGTTASPVVAIGGNFENDGAIQSAFGYGADLVGSVGGTVTNTGTINVTVSQAVAAGGSCNGHPGGAGVCATGIFIYGTVSGNLVNTGTLTVGGAPVPGNDVFGSGIIVDAVSGNIVNSGTITGKNGYGIAVGRTVGSGTSGVIATAGNVGGSIVNAGAITSGMTGILVGNVGGAVTNTGTIASSGGFGMYVGGSAAAGLTNSGLISGVTGLYMGGAGANVFDSGTITGTGGTAIQFGGAGNTLTLGPGFAINGNVLGSGGDMLQLGGSGAAVFNAGAVGAGMQYQGFATFNKIGSSTWTLTGSNAIAMPWTIFAGTLNVNGTLANSTMTVNGGTLAGTGTVGNTTINNGGTLMPGNGTPGTFLTVNGNLAFQSGALYLVQVNSTATTFSNVTGTAALAGTVQVISPANSFRFNSPYTILTSGGLGGSQFNALTTPTGVNGSLTYTPNKVLLNLMSGLGQLPGETVNQRTVGSALDAAFNSAGGVSGPLGAIFAGNVAQNLAQLTGEVATGSQQTTFDAMGLFLGLLTDPFAAGRGNPVTSSSTPAFAEEDDSASAYAGNRKPRSKGERDAYAMVTKAPAMADPFAQRWSLWASGFGGSQTTDGNAVTGSNAVTSRVYGTAVGADYRFSPFTIAGFALAGGGTNFSVANAVGTGRSDLFQAGAYVRHAVGPAYISGALAYGWQDITTDRTVTIAGLDLLRAEFNANAFSGRAEGGYRFATPWIGVTPYAAAQFTTFDLPAYSEQAIAGANTFALAYAAKDVTASRSELGVRTDKSWAMQDSIFTLRGRFAWAHDFNTDRTIAATFQTLPGASFVVGGAEQAHDAALTTASAEVKWTNGWSAAATFEGEFSEITRSYAGKGVVRYAW